MFFSRIELSINVTSEIIKRILTDLKNKYKLYKIQFKSDSFEAEFDFDLDRLNRLILEFRDFISIKIFIVNEIELFISNRNDFIFILDYDCEIRDYIISILSIKWAYTMEYLDYQLQTTDKPGVWEINGRKIPKNVELLNDPNDWLGKGKKIINMETLPGHQHIMRGAGDRLWFGAAWQMFFSELYYKYIPKKIWDDYQDCKENRILENGLRTIILYENIEDYFKEGSEKTMWNFRLNVGIDSIAHEVCNVSHEAKNDFLIEITKKGCEFGQTKVMRYLDKKHKLVRKSKSKYIEETEYFEDGITIAKEALIKAK